MIRFANCTMNGDFSHLMGELKADRPFCFVRINDGEATAIKNGKGIISRGQQKVDASLAEELKKVAEHRQEEYWIGLPCPECQTKHFETASQLVEYSYPYQTLAVVFNNNNWQRAVQHLEEGLKGSCVWVVAGEDQHWGNTDINVENFLPVPEKDAWSCFKEVLPKYEELPPRCKVMLSCGPMSRVLAKHWYEKRPDCTFIDIGSCFDPWTKGVRHRYQQLDKYGYNSTPYCKFCNTRGKTGK